MVFPTYRVPFRVVSPSTSKLLFIDTSPSTIKLSFINKFALKEASFCTYNLLLNDTSPETYILPFKDISSATMNS